MPGSYEEAVNVYRAFTDGTRAIGATNISCQEEISGCSRHVYRIGDVVYKIDAFGDNEREYLFFTHFKDEPWSSPVSLYTVAGELILCMPYYEQDKGISLSFPPHEIENTWLRWARNQPFYNPDYTGSDFHSGNFRVVKDQVKIIDGAGSGWDDWE